MDDNQDVTYTVVTNGANNYLEYTDNDGCHCYRLSHWVTLEPGVYTHDEIVSRQLHQVRDNRIDQFYPGKPFRSYFPLKKDLQDGLYTFTEAEDYTDYGSSYN